MLISHKDDLFEVLQAVRHEVRRGSLDRKHPFRFVVLSTLGSSVASRYVVLRHLSPDFEPIIYTDVRSAKVKQISSNPAVQLLFYHPQKRVQVIVSGEASVESETASTRDHWSNVQGEAKKSYGSVLAPGTEIADVADAYTWDELITDRHFAMITVSPIEIEVLQLNNAEHLRARFTKQDDWTGTWLVP